MTSPGVPWTLWTHGNDWSGEPIGGVVSRQAGRATASSLDIDKYWHGQVADAYRDTLGPQEKALTWIKTVADEIDDVLAKVANRHRHSVDRDSGFPRHNVPFPGGRWPKTTGEYTSDGSITDGDTTAWRLAP